MKKILVAATVLVALVALFSFSVSAADVSLDTAVKISKDAKSVTLNKIAINLSDAPETTGYYTALAQVGDEIVFAAQEVAPITGFNLDPAKLGTSPLTVKLGGTGLTGNQVAKVDSTFEFAFAALNADGKALKLGKYGEGVSLTADGEIHSFVVFGAEIMNATDAAGYVDVTKPAKDDDSGLFAVRSFRTVVAAQ